MLNYIYRTFITFMPRGLIQPLANLGQEVDNADGRLRSAHAAFLESNVPLAADFFLNAADAFTRAAIEARAIGKRLQNGG